jgi:hypothetical protein
LFSIFIAFATNLYSQCYNQPGCENIPWNSYTENFTHPNFPECQITVLVYHRVCNGRTQILVKNLGFYELFASNCDALIKWLWPNDEWQQGILPDPDKLDEIYNYAYEELVQKKIEFAVGLFGLTYFNCNGGYIGEWNTFSIFKGACRSYCFHLLSSTTGGSMRMYLTKSNCGIQCCEERISYCWDSELNELRKTIDVTPSSGSPECSTLPTPECEIISIPGYNYFLPPSAGPCRVICE